MKISIIGSNGFLSTAIVKYACEQMWEINIYGIDPPATKGYRQFYKINLMNEKMNFEELIKSDIIVYAAGAGIQSNLKENANLIYGLNVTVPVSICNQLKEHKYSGVFITFGSVFEIGETNENHPFTEEELLTSTCHAPNDYTVSKRMLSKYITSYTHQFTHWHFIIPTIYGKGENPNRLIPYVVNAIVNDVPMHFTSGEQIRQYIHVSEIPKVIKMAYDNNLPSGMYNLPGKECHTVKEIVSLIHSKFNIEPSKDCFGSVNRTDVGMKYLALDGSKLTNLLGFEPTVSIADALHEYAEI